ncbi:MAG: hypothetical protein AAFS12_05495 [Cyanobacteria bacterium J06632_19]
MVFPETPERIKRGLLGSEAPYIVQTPELFFDEEIKEEEQQLGN